MKENSHVFLQPVYYYAVIFSTSPSLGKDCLWLEYGSPLFFHGIPLRFFSCVPGSVLAWRQIQLDKKTEKSKRSCLNDQD
jgi:hypothetical protein